MADPPTELVASLATAMGTFDPLAAWYLDRVEPRVLEVRDGEVVDHPDLDAESVDRDEERYVEIPAATTADEHAWLTAFQEAHGADWPHIRIDQRRGANGRFLKSLAKSQPQAVAAWQAFRTERLRELAREWLDDQSEA